MRTSWKSVRNRARKEDNYTCQCCGDIMSESDKVFDVHHIIPQKEGGPDALDNLVLVCRSCHAKIEGTDFVPEYSDGILLNKLYNDLSFETVLNNVESELKRNCDHFKELFIYDQRICNYCFNNKYGLASKRPYIDSYSQILSDYLRRAFSGKYNKNSSVSSFTDYHYGDVSKACEECGRDKVDDDVMKNFSQSELDMILDNMVNILENKNVDSDEETLRWIVDELKYLPQYQSRETKFLRIAVNAAIERGN